MRLDKYLVSNGYFESRNRAHDAIKTGKVTVNQNPSKPSQNISDKDIVEVANEKFYVSRAAKKLEGFLAEFPLELRGKRALDIGSSTGGFTQILLENGASSVDCVDVGTDQLHKTLRDDNRVRVFEQTDIRNFESDILYDVIVSDVSFISLLHILTSVDRLSQGGADILLLFKPQFEVGREAHRDSKGVVTDEASISQAMTNFEEEAEKLSWELRHKAPSHLSGKEGNREIVYHFRAL